MCYWKPHNFQSWWVLIHVLGAHTQSDYIILNRIGIEECKKQTFSNVLINKDWKFDGYFQPLQRKAAQKISDLFYQTIVLYRTKSSDSRIVS